MSLLFIEDVARWISNRPEGYMKLCIDYKIKVYIARRVLESQIPKPEKIPADPQNLFGQAIDDIFLERRYHYYEEKKNYIYKSNEIDPPTNRELINSYNHLRSSEETHELADIRELTDTHLQIIPQFLQPFYLSSKAQPIQRFQRIGRLSSQDIRSGKIWFMDPIPIQLSNLMVSRRDHERIKQIIDLYRELVRMNRSDRQIFLAKFPGL